MEAKELMIGDWVMLSDCEIPIKMEDVSGSSLFKRWADNGNVCIPFSYSEIEPITLTQDILEKNGFELCEGSNYEWCAYIKDGIVSYIVYITPLRNKMSIEIADTGHVIFDWFVDSIHQMQHALRLCGLNELADNLKV